LNPEPSVVINIMNDDDQNKKYEKNGQQKDAKWKTLIMGILPSLVASQSIF